MMEAMMIYGDLSELGQNSSRIEVNRDCFFFNRVRPYVEDKNMIKRKLVKYRIKIRHFIYY